MEASGTDFGRWEILEQPKGVEVDEAEYRRLLGYPGNHDIGERARELSTWAREYYLENGRPWVYLREAALTIGEEGLALDGFEVKSQRLHRLLREAGAKRALYLVVSAGSECEAEARRRWQEAKPDEYFFLEMYGSAVVEHLVATLSGRLCARAKAEGWAAIPHYSPGYTGWDVEDQAKLFTRIRAGVTRAWPGPLEILDSGMLRPKKSLIGLVGLRKRVDNEPDVRLTPCENCGLAGCQYRRRPYRGALRQIDSVAAEPQVRPKRQRVLTQEASYTVNLGALKKWSVERVRLERTGQGGVRATFLFDGTTCSNLGRPLAFDYEIGLSGRESGFVVLAASCRPRAGDTGHRYMCEYLRAPEELVAAIETEKPFLGRPLDEILRWERRSASTGCYCDPDARKHKWGLALEAIHYALAQAEESFT